MSLTAHLMRVLGAAIVLIAVQFISLPAQAHSGHAHAHHGVVAHHHALVAETGQALHAAQPAELRSADQDVPNATVAGSNCTAGCCGFGVNCCGCTALAVVADQPLPSTRSSSVGLERSAATSGIDPDALRKPPRSLI